MRGTGVRMCVCVRACTCVRACKVCVRVFGVYVRVFMRVYVRVPTRTNWIDTFRAGCEREWKCVSLCGGYSWSGAGGSI